MTWPELLHDMFRVSAVVLALWLFLKYQPWNN